MGDHRPTMDCIQSDRRFDGFDNYPPDSSTPSPSASKGGRNTISALWCEIHATFLARNNTHLVFQGIARLSEIPVKDVVIVVFMLSLWAYSIALIVRAWAKVNLNANRE